MTTGPSISCSPQEVREFLEFEGDQIRTLTADHPRLLYYKTNQATTHSPSKLAAWVSFILTPAEPPAQTDFSLDLDQLRLKSDLYFDWIWRVNIPRTRAISLFSNFKDEPVGTLRRPDTQSTIELMEYFQLFRDNESYDIIHRHQH